MPGGALMWRLYLAPALSLVALVAAGCNGNLVIDTSWNGSNPATGSGPIVINLREAGKAIGNGQPIQVMDYSKLFSKQTAYQSGMIPRERLERVTQNVFGLQGNQVTAPQSVEAVRKVLPLPYARQGATDWYRVGNTETMVGFTFDHKTRRYNQIDFAPVPVAANGVAVGLGAPAAGAAEVSTPRNLPDPGGPIDPP